MSDTKSKSNMRNFRWDDAEWERIAATAKAVGLTRSEFIRRAAAAAMAFPAALCAPNFGAHNAASGRFVPLKTKSRKSPQETPETKISEGGDSQESMQLSDGDSRRAVHAMGA